MTLKLYNTLTRLKDPFKPIDPENVRMYVCGPTVYDYAHIGNARPVIVFDVLYRLLRHLYGAEHVTYVRNITDVDDKINARALEEGVDIRDLTDRTLKQFHDDIGALGVLPPDHEPRATEHVDEMIAMIKTLIERGNAYEADGHVLFHVPSMPEYGRLSNRSLDEMVAGARVEVASYKKDPTDFVLWKPSQKGEPAWPSPWGDGRPGWHIECSAMSDKWLWENVKDKLSENGKAHPHEFDIHGGGLDLIFPHHENEIAQSTCAHGSTVMANVWMHNGYLQVEGEKMSKSLGNFITIHELLETDSFGGKKWPGIVIHYAMLMTQYRQPFDFTEQALEEASIALTYFKRFGYSDTSVIPSKEFLEALNDDLNTPRAIAELHRLLGVSKDATFSRADRMTKPNPEHREDDDYAASQLVAGLELMGIEIDDFDAHWLQNQRQQKISSDQSKEISNMIKARNAARADKNWAEADRIRDELAEMGIILKDSTDGTTWEVSR